MKERRPDHPDIARAIRLSAKPDPPTQVLAQGALPIFKARSNLSDDDVTFVESKSYPCHMTSRARTSSRFEMAIISNRDPSVRIETSVDTRKMSDLTSSWILRTQVTQALHFPMLGNLPQPLHARVLVIRISLPPANRRRDFSYSLKVQPATSRNISRTSFSTPLMSASISSSGRGGVYL